MKAALVALCNRWLALPRRERALLVSATIVCVVGVGDLALLEPALKERARLLRQIGEQKAGREAIEATAGAAARDPDAAARLQLETLQAQLRDTDRDFRSMQSGVVQPQQMGALLQSLLAEQRGLRLLGLRSLPVTVLGDAAAARKPAADKTDKTDKADKAEGADRSVATAPPRGDEAWLYRHAVEVRVQGGYADMLAYLRAIESLPRRVRWGDVEIDARAYPDSTMTITLYTVSLEKTWWVL